MGLVSLRSSIPDPNSDDRTGTDPDSDRSHPSLLGPAHRGGTDRTGYSGEVLIPGQVVGVSVRIRKRRKERMSQSLSQNVPCRSLAQTNTSKPKIFITSCCFWRLSKGFPFQMVSLISIT